MKIKTDPVSKIKKTKQKKTKISICAFASFIFLYSFYVYNAARIEKTYESMEIAFTNSKEIEYGSAYNPLDLIDHVSQGSIKSYTENIDTKELGKKEVTFEIVKDDVIKKVSVEIEVKDTNAPTINLNEQEITIYVGDDYDINSNIQNVSDVIDGDLVYSEQESDDINSYYVVSSDFDKTKAGTYTVYIKAIDSNKNITEASYNIIVKEKPKPKLTTTQNKVYSNRPSTVDTSSVVAAAYSLLGTKYSSGGTSTSTGFDCSGFVQYIYNAVGKAISRSSSSQANEGIEVQESNLQPGDIIIWAKNGSNKASHSSVYAGDDTIIHATSNKGVQQTNLSGWKSWGKQHIIGIRRV